MRLSLLTATSLATASVVAVASEPSRRNARNGGGQAVIEQVLGDIRRRMLLSDGVAGLTLASAGQEQQSPQGRRELWKTREQPQRSIYDYPDHRDNDKDEPDVGILSQRRRQLDEQQDDDDVAVDQGTVGEYNDYKFCDLFLELGAFENLVCDCQNSPRARVSCQSPKVCYHSVEPNVCLKTKVDMAPRQDEATLNLQVCYQMIEPNNHEYCFNTDIDYASFFDGNSTIYESCFLTVDGEACNTCEITSASENDLNCTGLSDFDCSNTAAGSRATKECSTFYNPFPEVTRIEGIDSAAAHSSRSSIALGMSLVAGAAMAWGALWL